MLATFVGWFTNEGRYHDLIHCMNGDVPWIALTVALDLAVAAGYILIARHWWINQRSLPDNSAPKRALASMRNIFVFCGICGYLFIPIKMFWPAWRLYDIFLVFLVYFTWRYAWGAKKLQVVFNALGRSEKLEKDLAASRAESERKSFFMNAVNHDLRTPLNGLMLQVGLAELAVADNDSELLQESLVGLKASAQAAADLLNTLLEVSRLERSPEENRLSVFSVDDLVDSILNSYQPSADAAGLFLKFKERSGVAVRTDRTKVTRILQNLIGNAFKFTTRGGVEIVAAASGPDIEIAVMDTGVGISADHQERLFEEFFQVHNDERDRRKGFGLGLSIARRLARHLGGDIRIFSEVGVGSRSSSDSPEPPFGMPGHIQPHREAAPGAKPRQRVLIVEDDPTSRNALRAILRHKGYEVTVAESLAQATQLLEEGLDCLVLDLMLPDGNGTVLMDRIRDFNLSVRVVVTTGIHEPENFLRAGNFRPAAVLRKPLNLAEFLRALQPGS